MSVSIVWFKRDLRISDNQALSAAISSRQPVICLFNLEPERIDREDTDGIHIKWELDCLEELRKSLESIGGKLLFNHGNVVEELSRLHQQYEIKNVFSHFLFPLYNYLFSSQELTMLQFRTLKFFHEIL